MRRADLAGLTGFVAVADNLSFPVAAARLGVTPSALSHTMRQLEERLSYAGLRRLNRLRPAVEQVRGAVEDLKSEQGHSFGRLDLYVSISPMLRSSADLGALLSTFTDVQLEIHTAEASVDIVAKGFDARIGPRDWAAAGMIAIRMISPSNVAVVGAPGYFRATAPP